MKIKDRDMSRVTLVQAKNGHFSLKVDNEDGTSKTLHSIYDPVAEAKSVVDAFKFEGRGILVVLGLGLGYHVAELSNRYSDADIIVIEALQEIAEIAKEHGPVLDNRIIIISGEPPAEALKKITEIQMKLGLVPVSLFTLNSAVSAYENYYRPVLNSLESIVSVRLWERLKYRKFREDKLKVVLVDSGYFLVQEVEKALSQLGHTVVKVQLSKDDSGEKIVPALIESIAEVKPDFMITMNHLGFDEEGALTAFFRSIEMPVASWYVDSPSLIVRAFDKNVSPYTSIFMWDKSYISDIESIGFESIKYLPLGTDVDVFKPITTRKHRKKLQKYACEIGFIGNSMIRPVEKYMAKVNTLYHPLIERIADELAESGGCYDQVDKIMNEDELLSISKLGKKEKMDFEAAVIWKATLLYRLSCLQMLEGFNVNIHGDSEWSLLLNHRNCTLRPPLNYYKELPLFYNACNINFNSTSRQMKEAVNQRVFDVPACGAFLLTDYQESIEDLFDVGNEIIAYKDRQEIPEIAEYYLKNPEKRQSIALKARERVLNEHTYKHRLNSMIEYMKQRYK